jgi:ankyrin repeat protein
MGKTTIVKLLLEAGADKEAKDEVNLTCTIVSQALTLIYSQRHESISHFTSSLSSFFRPCLLRLKRFFYDIISLFLSSPYFLCQNGQTALNYVAGSGHFDMVKLLLEAGADKDAEDEVRIPPIPLVFVEIS